MIADIIIAASLSPDSDFQVYARTGDGRWHPAGDASPTAGSEAVILLDARDVFAQAAELPARSERQARTAAPFLIEDHLATPLESCHVALGARADGHNWRLMTVVDSAALSALLKRVRAAGYTPIAVYSEADLLAETGSLAQLPDRILLKDRDGCPRGLDASLAQLAPALAQQSVAGEKEADPDSTDHAATPGSQDLAGEPAPAKLDGLSALLNSDTLDDLDARATNLLQGSFAPRSDWSQAWLIWRTPLRLAVAAVVLLLVGHIASIIATEQKAAALDEQASALMQRAFPGARNEAHMRQMLSAGAAKGGDPFLSLVSLALDVVQETSDVQLTRLRYNASQQSLDLAVSAGRYDDIAAMKKLVEARGATFVEGSSRTSGTRVESNIEISRSGP